MADFASEYGDNLHRLGNAMPWVEFVDKLTGLLSADTRTARHFAPDKREEADDE